uniref:Uncharacterized protein n=1 Tax=Schistosoma haematobium TaxID=6185 RepID=A0A094ZPV0_SCHHA
MNGIILTGSLFLSLCNMAMMQIVVEKVPLINHKQSTMKFTFSEVNVTFTLDRTLTLQCKQRTTVLKLTPPTKEEKRAHGGNRPCSFLIVDDFSVYDDDSSVEKISL